MVLSSNPGRCGPTTTFIRYNYNVYLVINLKVKVFIFDMTGEYTCDSEETVWTLESAMEIFKVETEAELVEAAEGHKETGCPTFTVKNARVEEIELTDVTEVSDGEIWGVKLYKERAYGVELFDTPWEETTELTYFGNAYLADCYRGEIYSKDFAYFTCDCCGRIICQQNPRNGWHVQMRVMNDCETLCLKCVEELTLSEGITAEECGMRTGKTTAAGIIDGEVYIDGTVYRPKSSIGAKAMFHSHSELRDAGFTEGHSFYVTDEASARRVNYYMLERIAAGSTVLVDLDRMAIGGLEGYVTVWTRPGEKTYPVEKAVVPA